MTKDGGTLIKKSKSIIADSKVTIARSKGACKRAHRLKAARQLRRAKLKG